MFTNNIGWFDLSVKGLPSSDLQTYISSSLESQ